MAQKPVHYRVKRVSKFVDISFYRHPDIDGEPPPPNDEPEPKDDPDPRDLPEPNNDPDPREPGELNVGTGPRLLTGLKDGA